MHDGPPGWAFETGTGGIGQDDYLDSMESDLTETWQHGIDLPELQQAAVSLIGPTALQATTTKGLKALVGATSFEKLIKPSIQARQPARIVLQRHLPGVIEQVRKGHVPPLRVVVAETGAIVDMGEVFGEADDDGSVPGVNADLPDGAPAVAGQAPPELVAKAMANGWPPPAAYRPGNWDFDNSIYSLALGDTLSGLAITYLGSPQRWKEIWNANPQDWRWNHNPDKLMAGEKIVMPFEARDMAKKMLATPGSNPPAPSTIGKKAPIPVPGENPNAPVVAGGTSAAAGSMVKKYWPYAAGGVAALTVGYFALK